MPFFFPKQTATCSRRYRYFAHTWDRRRKACAIRRWETAAVCFTLLLPREQLCHRVCNCYSNRFLSSLSFFSYTPPFLSPSFVSSIQGACATFRYMNAAARADTHTQRLPNYGLPTWRLTFSSRDLVGAPCVVAVLLLPGTAAPISTTVCLTVRVAQYSIFLSHLFQRLATRSKFLNKRSVGVCLLNIPDKIFLCLLVSLPLYPFIRIVSFHFGFVISLSLPYTIASFHSSFSSSIPITNK